MNLREPSRTPRSSDASLHDTPEPALGLPLERADAMLPADLLQGDEIIILLLKPSPWYILLGCLGTLGVIVAIAVLGVWLQGRFGLDYDPNDVIALAFGLIFIRVFWQFLQWLSRTYVLTDRRVIRIKGFFRVAVFQTELKHLQHTDLLFSIRERVFGLGTISLSTAGTGMPEAYWMMLAHPLTVHRKIIQTINRYRR